MTIVFTKGNIENRVAALKRWAIAHPTVFENHMPVIKFLQGSIHIRPLVSREDFILTTALPQLLLHKFVHNFWVGLAAGGFEYLSDKETEEFAVPVSVFLYIVGILCNDLIDNR